MRRRSAADCRTSTRCWSRRRAPTRSGPSTVTVIIPVHPGDMATGTWKAIETQLADVAGTADWLTLSRKEWKASIKGRKAREGNQ